MIKRAKVPSSAQKLLKEWRGVENVQAPAPDGSGPDTGPAEATADNGLSGNSGKGVMEMNGENESMASGQTQDGVGMGVQSFREMLEHAPVNVAVLDTEEAVLFINRAGQETYDAIEWPLRDVLAETVKGIRPGQVRRLELAAEGRTFDVEIRLLVGDRNKRIGYSIFWTDVSETETSQHASELQRWKNAVEGAQTAMMMVDRDFIITYANTETVQLLKGHEETLRGLFPGFSADKLLGSCIDMFHKNPSHQRRMLSDPSILPYETDIVVGPLRFHLRVSAIHDAEGAYVGNTLEWSDVTQARESEISVARLQSAVDGASTALMLCDEEFRISYANPAVVKLLANRERELQQIFPNFSVRTMIGTCIDVFHRDPRHQRSLLSDPSRLPFNSEIKVGDLQFNLTATAVTAADGSFMGAMVEWRDITAQKDAERQIRELVGGAASGDFSRRIDTGSYTGFIQQLGEQLNQLMDVSESGLTDVAQVIKSLSKGDLTGQVVKDYSGLFGQLKDDVNMTVDNLREMVGQIRDAAMNISSSASEISLGNTDLSQRTEEQASSLEETASSMEEMTSAVKSSADNARQANQLAAGARDQAESGGAVVGRAVEAMSAINDASKKIADIIGVIDEIAFQTNLLALNAAVEAARAGEQGRGFAVVATEVRNLAQRSAQAAKEIKSLIKDSVEKVEEGSRLVGDSGNTLSEIVTAVKKVSDIIAEIAAASQEQSAGIEQVNKAVTQLDETTQQNAALVEEAAASSEALDEQARSLTELMVFFNTGADESDRVAPRKVSRPKSAAAPVRAVPSKVAGSAQARKPAPTRQRAPVDDSDEEWDEF